jgi:CHAD domain-containing protein
MLLIRYAELNRLSACINDASRVSELHDMRIAAKRLRYTMEIYQPCFVGAWQKEYKACYEKIKAVQSILGDIHDCDVRAPAIAEFLTAHSERRPEIVIGLSNLVKKESQRRTELFDQFVLYWREMQNNGYRARFFRFAMALSPLGLEPPAPASAAKAQPE